jgi:LPPG:FO 2-phospho-L-lactate transferase
MNVVALAGGTGGAKLAHGLQEAAAPGELTVIVNTGDDTERHGLLVMPDHDSIMYMLSGRFDDERGWGVAGETWAVIEALERYGEDVWFRLGDRDIATHIARTARLREGRSLTEAVIELQRALGIPSAILPMADDQVRTRVRTEDGWLDFQEYFVHQHQAPEVLEIRFDGIENARPTAQVRSAIGAADIIVIGPSNPIVSLGPILAVPALAELLARARARGATVVAVSGIVGGKALKGPADRMLTSLGHEVSALGVATMLAPHLDAFVLDQVDAALEPAIAALGLSTLVTDTIMVDVAGRERLARAVLEFAGPPDAAESEAEEGDTGEPEPG